MAGPPGFTPARSPHAVMGPRNNAITTLAQAGWSQRKIAQAFGLTQPAILKILRRCSRAPAGDTLQEACTETAPVGDNYSTANQQTETQSEPRAPSVPQGGNGAPGGASREDPGRCPRVFRCQGRLWQTVTGYIFCEQCGPKPYDGWFARWVTE